MDILSTVTLLHAKKRAGQNTKYMYKWHSNIPNVVMNKVFIQSSCIGLSDHLFYRY